MAFQVGSACYGAANEAAQASASAQVGAIVQHGGTAYVIDATAVAAESITYALYPVGGGTAISVTSAYTAQPCNLLEFSDGLQLGWLVGGVWLGVFCVLMLRKAIEGWGNQDGNS